MTYLFRRGPGALHRVMHLCGYDPRTGRPTMVPLCGIKQRLNTTSNVPWARPVCKRCRKLARDG